MNKQQFSIVYIPADDALEMEEWKIDLPKDVDEQIGCLTERLRAHFKQKTGGATTEEQRGAFRQQILAQMPKGATMNDEMMAMMLQMDSLVDSVPLIVNSPAVQHVGVNMYVDDKGTAKNLPINMRASAIAQTCGKMLEVRGDAFIGRVFDNDDAFVRMNFKLSEINGDAEWIKVAQNQSNPKVSTASISGHVEFIFKLLHADMIEGRIKALVEKLLGEWIESDKLDLHINVLQDENVRCHNVNLKDSVIPNFLPFRLKAGLIGSLALSIPFKSLGTTPAKVTLSDVLVILSPRQLNEDEKAKEIQNLKLEKRALLEKDILERIHGPPIDKTQFIDENNKNENGYYGADGFFGRLVTRLMDNLQVELKNVHIRFEGERESKFAVGFSIGALYAETTGGNWRTGQYSNGPDENGDHVVFKLIQAINLSAYVDPHALHFVHTSKHPKVLHVTLARLKTMADMNSNIRWWTQHNEQHTHRFVLAPFHVTLKLTMNVALKTLHSSIPRYDALFEITKLIGMLDNEQMVLIMWILDSFGLHDQWRNAIACSVLANERQNFNEDMKKKYLAHWKAFQILHFKQHNWETLKKSEQWKQLLLLEQLLPLDTIVHLRNEVDLPFESNSSDHEVNQSAFAMMGEVYSVPTPEVSLKFEGPKDFGLKFAMIDGSPVVVQCFGQARDKKVIKPGMILIKVNNKTPNDYLDKDLDGTLDLVNNLKKKIGKGSALFTFRHPEVVPAIVTPDQIVSSLRFVANEVELRIVLTTCRKVVSSATFQGVDIAIQGFGPGFFSYHSYSIVAQHFYLQESIAVANSSSCIISSVDQMRSAPQSKPSLWFRMNYLEKDHPAVIPSDLSTYATEYGLHVGDIVIVYDAKKFQKFMAAWSEFSTLAFPPRPQIDLSSFIEENLPTTSTITDLNAPQNPSPCNIKYTASFGSLRCFVGCAVVPMRRATSTSKPTYQSIFSQLTIHNTTTTIQDWLRENFMLEKVVKGIIHFQRYVRGALVRKVAFPLLNKKTRCVVKAVKKEVSLDVEPVNHLVEGYIYKEDIRLRCQRWEELYFVLENGGVLRIYKDNSLASYIDSFLIEQLQSVVVLDKYIMGPLTQESLYYLKLTFLVEFQVHNTIQEAPPHSSSIELLLAYSDKSVMEWWKLKLEELHELYKNNALDLTSRQPRMDKIGLRTYTMGKFPMDVHKGWLFRQDLSLAFRRWHEYFVFLDEFGVLRFYESHTGRALIGEEYVEQVDSVLHVGNISQMVDWENLNQTEKDKDDDKKNNRESVRIKHIDFEHLGPAGDSATTISYCLEVTLKSESIVDGKKSTTTSSFLLASYSAKELADWRQSLFVKCQAVRNHSVDISRRQKKAKLGWSTWLRSHLPLTFTSTLKPCQKKNVWAMYGEMSSWITLYASGVSLSFCQHYPSQASLEEAGAFSVDFSVNKLEVRDRRWQRTHSVLYLGDTFLEYENGKLQAVAITSEHLDNKGSLRLRAFYRGPSALVKFEGCTSPGLNVNLIFCGCLMPHDFNSAITDALKELSPLWTSDTSTSVPPGAPEPYLRVPNAHLDVQIPMLEAYFEEKHCVAKLTMEKNKLVYSTAPDAEKLDLRLGSMSLYVMTKDNQLRLAQIESFQINYEFLMASLQRSTTIKIGQIKLEADGRMRILYQLFEALQHTEEDEYDDIENQEYLDYMDMVQTPPDSPTRLVELTPHSPASSTRFKRARRVESQYSARSIQSARSYRARPSQRSLRSMRSELGSGPLVQYIGPILSFQSFVALAEPSLHRVWHQVQDTIKVECEAIVFEVVKRSLSRVAMDTYIPVMKLSLSKLSILGSTGSECKLDYLSTVSVVLLARYYNTALADWEPLVEPWMVTMDVSKSPRQQLGIILKARERLNINFTEALVRLLCSVQKHRKLALPTKQNGFLLPPTAEQYECVSVWNNLGVPIRLANLNTSNPGELTIEIRDGWSLPHYTRFHDVQVEAVLLPWWSPQESSGILDSLSHTFKMEYGGANAGVAPKLRVKVSALIEKHEHAVQMQLDGTQAMISEENTNANDKWVAVGTVELNLSGSLMGTSDPESKRIKFCQWHRLRDSRGVITGEILVALHFTPRARPLGISQTTVLTVASGGSLTVDPFRLGSQVNTRESADGDSKMSVKLPESIRNGYVPPLALEVLIDNNSRSLLCPLQRAGKFFIRGENVVAEVKVAQRDEFRRVLMLSSPKQLKNLTGLSMNVGTFPSTDISNFAAEDEADSMRSRSISTVRKESMTTVPPGGKYSLPLSALYSDLEHCLVLQLMQSKRTKIANISDLHKKVGCHIVYLEPLSSSSWGYCLFMEIVEHVRNVYREQQYDMNIPGQIVSNVSEVDEVDIMGHDAKYQVRLHAGFVFENALPIRLRYKVEVTVNNGLPMLLCEGTLAPGEEVELYQFHKNANILLSLPEEASNWSAPISLARCISQEATHISNQTISAADLPNQRRATDTMPFYKRTFDPVTLFHTESHIFTARLDYTVADNGSPRTVIYATVWLYNYSQVSELLVRSAESTSHITSCRKLLPESTPRLMDCPLLVLEMSTIFEHEVARWSDKIHASVVGVQRSATLRSVKSKCEVGVSIHRPLGQFHRSTQIAV
ncbi:hypothetical protein THRCLA_00373 [Thraustotheca clavata]|uniref:PH domain-containing protein n=1 Tax=Thraustotheca clavata TaxID=74557 RepID=A0A1W0ABC2_9STRA|nr:hypothetical protein THRCLA_00373 [Thraustotheca clavata]